MRATGGLEPGHRHGHPWILWLGGEARHNQPRRHGKLLAWTEDMALLPKSKQVWLAESLLFGDDDDDLLLDYSLFECNNKYLVMYDLIYIRLHILHTSIYLEK
jgi:hypothetical protein